MVCSNDIAKLDFCCINLMQDQFTTVMVPEKKLKSFTHSRVYCAFSQNKLEVSE